MRRARIASQILTGEEGKRGKGERGNGKTGNAKREKMGKTEKGDAS
jgi:hypothetical protein